MKQGGAWSWALAALLAAGVFVESVRLVERHVHVRRDLSEDQLLAPSEATARLLRALDDVAQLELFVTQESESAPFILTRGRVLEELGALVDLADGRLRTVSVDPSRSSAAELEAEEYGVAPLDINTVAGSRLSIERAYLGGVLRYRGAEHVIPAFYPGAVEYQVVSGLDRVVRTARPSLGWLTGSVGPERFRTARDVLAQRFEIVSLGGLEEGNAIEDVDAVCVVAPKELTPRAVYELDQYVQSGGDLLLVLDRSYAGDEQTSERRLEAVDTGLEAWLASVGVTLSSDLVWDSRYHRSLPLRRVVREGSGTLREQNVSLPFPHWPTVVPTGFDQENPATARMPGLPLRWSHPLRFGDDAPEGVEITALIETSERSWATPFSAQLEFDAEAIQIQEAELLAGEDPARQVVAAVVEGSFPSPFAERGAPLARDPFGGPDRAIEGDGEVLSGGDCGRVVVFGDADWLAGNGGRMAGESRVLIENLADWLAVSSELLELRAKRPSDRSLVDFEREEFERRGLSLLGGVDTGTTADRSLAETEALDAAAARRRGVMWRALLTSVLAVVGLATLVRIRRALRWRNVTRPVTGEVAP